MKCEERERYMAIQAVLFDLDGTLLPMDQDVFIGDYFRRIAAYFAPHGYDPKKLVDSIWRGTAAMIQNDGSCTNEEAFWKVAEGAFCPKILEDKPLFDRFYEEEFDKIKAVCGYHPMAAEIIRDLKARGLRVILATNPLFPARATQWRIQWAGLQKEDFELVTTYENSSYCKPNPDYYRQILAKQGLQPENCLMVGNDVGEDMVTRKLGMEVFLLTDCLINKANADIDTYPHGGFPELQAFLGNL